MKRKARQRLGLDTNAQKPLDIHLNHECKHSFINGQI